MRKIGQYFGISLQAEVIILTVLGICSTIYDCSVLELPDNLQKLWGVELNPEAFPENADSIMKYVLSAVVVVRTFSVHLYLIFYLLVLWPAVFEERPGLMLPWLLVSGIKVLVCGAVSIFAGLYTCALYGDIKLTCIEFFMAHMIENAPPMYVWFTILSYYHDLRNLLQIIYEEDLDPQMAIVRRKSRSLADICMRRKSFRGDGSTMMTDSSMETLLLQLSCQLDRRNSISLDALVKKMAEEGEKEQIVNLFDDMTTQIEGRSTEEKAILLLKLTSVEIAQAQKAKAERTNRHLLPDSELDLLIQHIDNSDFMMNQNSNLTHSRSDETLTSSVGSELREDKPERDPLPPPPPKSQLTKTQQKSQQSLSWMSPHELVSESRDEYFKEVQEIKPKEKKKDAESDENDLASPSLLERVVTPSSGTSSFSSKCSRSPDVSSGKKPSVIERAIAKITTATPHISVPVERRSAQIEVDDIGEIQKLFEDDARIPLDYSAETLQLFKEKKDEHAEEVRFRPTIVTITSRSDLNLPNDQPGTFKEVKDSVDLASVSVHRIIRRKESLETSVQTGSRSASADQIEELKGLNVGLKDSPRKAASDVKDAKVQKSDGRSSRRRSRDFKDDIAPARFTPDGYTSAFKKKPNR